MTTPRTYPQGVPCWIDTDQPDPAAAQEFYGELLDWTFAAPAPGAYVMASRRGRDVAGLAPAGQGPARWNTYLAVENADATVAAVWAAGGEVIAGPDAAGEAGRSAACCDPAGGAFRLWEAAAHPGSQFVNEPGGWNWSNLHVDAPEAAQFYVDLFGWTIEDYGFSRLVRMPGYGEHLEATADPGIRERQAASGAPSGFADGIGWVADSEPGRGPGWHVTLSVDDRDASAETALRLGGEVLSTEDTQWARLALIRDPQGAVFTASQFTPPSDVS